MKRSARLLILSLMLISANLLSLAAQGAGTKQVFISIQFQDQTIYYEGDDVNIRVTLTNDSTEIYRLRLADTRMFSLDFDLKDLTNASIRPSENYTTVLSENKPIYVRDVTVLPGEDFSFVERLNNYRDLNAGVYVITAHLYPDLRGNASRQALQSNRLSVSIRPDIRRSNQIEDKIADQLQEVLKASNFPPDQVVAYTLSARQKSQREAFFLYLDLESLYKTEPRRAEVYRRLSEMDQLEALDNYRSDLWKTSTKDAISLVPSSWEIMRTSYSGSRGTVEVIQKYKNDFFTEVKEYKYFLEKKQEVWKITNYTVNNRGTE